MKSKRFELLDAVITAFLVIFALSIILPFWNVVVISFATQKEYMLRPLMMFPKTPSLESYRYLFRDGRILTGFGTTLKILVLGVPVNLFLTTSMAYGLSRTAFPFKKLLLGAVLLTMLFNGGIIPLYLVVKELGLTNSLWSVVLATGVNTFYRILMRSYFLSLPESLMESARLDGAGEWNILLRIVLPLSMPIMATITLFYAVDRWTEWYNGMIFLRKASLKPLQLVLREIILEAQTLAQAETSGASVEDPLFSNGMKMSAVVVTIVPVMCIFPVLQKHFVKGVMVGAIKS